MDYLEQSFSVAFDYRVYFTSGLFEVSNRDLAHFLSQRTNPLVRQKILFVIDEGVLAAHPLLSDQIRSYFAHNTSVLLVEEMITLPGGEEAKNHYRYLDSLLQSIDRNGIDRHSYVAAIGGGSVLDLAGFASAVAHRGIKHLRIPTTVLSQNDSGIGVKNGINYNGKKNFIGNFAPPVAVFNDERFLATLSPRDWRCGMAEAIKVALIKDAGFYYWIEDNMEKLAARDRRATNDLIRRCAALHLEHIASGDPFELGSSRPLDFGHWSAHKLEQESGFKILHGEAVAMGIALDTMYSALSGHLMMEKAERIIRLIAKAGFDISHPLLEIRDENSELLKGLQEFREHLGGQLTVMLLSDIGKGLEVHDLNFSILREASQKLEHYPQPMTEKIKN